MYPDLRTTLLSSMGVHPAVQTTDQLLKLKRTYQFTLGRFTLYMRELKQLIQQTRRKLSSNNTQQKATFIHNLPRLLTKLERSYFRIRHALNQQKLAIETINQSLKTSLSTSTPGVKNSGSTELTYFINRMLLELEASVTQLEKLRKIERLWYSPKFTALTDTVPTVGTTTTKNLKLTCIDSDENHTEIRYLVTRQSQENFSSYFMSSTGALPITLINPDSPPSQQILPKLEQLKSEIAETIFLIDDLAQRYRLTKSPHHVAMQQSLRTHIYHYATQATRFSEDIATWRKMISLRQLANLKRLVALQQPIENTKLDQEAIEQLQIELERTDNQTQKLNIVESLFDAYHAAIDLYSENPIAPYEQQLSQLSKEFNTILNEQDSLQINILRLHEKLPKFFINYQIACHTKTRAEFFAKMANELEDYRDEVRSINNLLSERFQQYLEAKRKIYLGRSLAELNSFFGAKCKIIVCLQAEAEKVRKKLNSQAKLVQDINLTLQAQSMWLIETQQRIPTVSEINSSRTQIDKIIVTVGEHQVLLNNYQYKCESLFSHTSSIAQISTDILDLCEGLKSVRSCLQHEQQKLHAIMCELGDFTINEIIALGSSQTENIVATKSNDINVMRTLIQKYLAEIAKQFQQILGIEHQLLHHQIWLKITCLTTDFNLNRLERKIKRIQEELRSMNTGTLSTISIDSQLHEIESAYILNDPSVMQNNYSVSDGLTKFISSQIINAQQSMGRLKLLASRLHEILHQLGVDLTIEQMTAKPLNLAQRKAQHIYNLCQRVHAQLTVCEQLSRRISEIIKHTTQKQSEMNNLLNKNKTFLFVKSKQESSAPNKLRPLIHPRGLQSKAKIVISDTGLPVFVEQAKLEFFPQSQLPINDRYSWLSENLYEYTSSNELDTLRQMVDQAISNKWRSLAIIDGFTENKIRRRIYLMVICARAELQNIEIDWNFLDQPNLTLSKEYRRVYLKEQTLLEQEKRNLKKTSLVNDVELERLTLFAG